MTFWASCSYKSCSYIKKKCTVWILLVWSVVCIIILWSAVWIILVWSVVYILLLGGKTVGCSAGSLLTVYINNYDAPTTQSGHNKQYHITPLQHLFHEINSRIYLDGFKYYISMFCQIYDPPPPNKYKKHGITWQKMKHRWYSKLDVEV